jgi:hypothetical protein
MDMTGAEIAMRGALLAALRGHAELAAQLNGVHDGTPLQASPPYAVVGEALTSEWGTKDAPGYELRIGIGLIDGADDNGRLGGMMMLADAAVRGVAAPEGWQIGSVAFLRSRVLRRTRTAREGGWSATMDYRVRMLRADAA